MPVINKVLVAHYEARGRPPTPTLGFDGFMMTPTPAGRYRVAYCARHSSQRRYRTWSLFRWGSDVKEDGGKVFVMHDGKWTYVAVCGLDRDAIAQYAWDQSEVHEEGQRRHCSSVHRNEDLERQAQHRSSCAV
jgi:hypothetical protein